MKWVKTWRRCGLFRKSTSFCLSSVTTWVLDKKNCIRDISNGWSSGLVLSPICTFVTKALLNVFKSHQYLECILDYKAAQRVHRIRQCCDFHLGKKRKILSFLTAALAVDLTWICSLNERQASFSYESNTFCVKQANFIYGKLHIFKDIKNMTKNWQRTKKVRVRTSWGSLLSCNYIHV